jgi:hypothetical protein
MESLSSLDQPVRFAIANKRLIQFIYKSKLRVAEPHDYGLKNGVAKLLVYQLHGQGTGFRTWKLLEVSKIQRLQVLERTFRGSRAAPGQRHMEWDELFVRVR